MAHRQVVLARLAAVSPRARAAFAASCAETLYPLYEQFAEEERRGDPALVRVALDATWRWARTGDGGGIDPAELADRVEREAPRSDGASSRLAPWAQNAALATAAALDAWAGRDAATVAAAADRVIEALDYVLAESDSGTAVRREPLARELERQRRALELAGSAGEIHAIRGDAAAAGVASFILERVRRPPKTVCQHGNRD